MGLVHISNNDNKTPPTKNNNSYSFVFPDDVAFSLKDGRFWGQIAKMMSQKEKFVKKGVEAQVQYVIEGKPENFLACCADGCQGVGRCGNPTLLQVQVRHSLLE